MSRGRTLSAPHLSSVGVSVNTSPYRMQSTTVRMALGATRNRVVALVLREGSVLAPIGMGLGLIGAYFVGRAMQSMLRPHRRRRPLKIFFELGRWFLMMDNAKAIRII